MTPRAQGGVISLRLAIASAFFLFFAFSIFHARPLFLRIGMEGNRHRCVSSVQLARLSEKLNLIVPNAIDESHASNDGNPNVFPEVVNVLLLFVGEQETHARDVVRLSESERISRFDCWPISILAFTSGEAIYREQIFDRKPRVVRDCEPNKAGVNIAVDVQQFARPIADIEKLLIRKSEMSVGLLGLKKNRRGLFVNASQGAGTYESRYSSEKGEDIIRSGRSLQSLPYILGKTLRFLFGASLIFYCLAKVYSAEDGCNRGSVIGCALTITGFLVIA
jgi:hypothetical protein